MVEQWSLLVLVVAVAAGLVAVTASAVLVRSRQTALYRTFLVQLLLFNLLILGGLVVRYVEMRGGASGVALHPALLPGLLAGLAAVKLGWLGSFTAMTLVLAGRRLPAGFGRRLAAGLAVAFGAWTAVLVAGMVTGSSAAVEGTLVLMEVVVIGGAAAACLRLLASRSMDVPTSPSGPRRPAATLLAAIYLGIFVLMLGSFAKAMLRPSGQPSVVLLLNASVMVLYNLLPLPWVLRLQATGSPASAAAMERFGISPREREVIELICAGRTNQEIADRLFISLATVKDHNSNVFRKTGVRNRVELTNLFRGERGGEGSGEGPGRRR